MIKKTSGSGVKSMPQNQKLAEELHKQIIRKFKKRRVYSSFRGNIWGVDLADMQSVNLIKELDFDYVLLIFLANMLRLFL